MLSESGRLIRIRDSDIPSSGIRRVTHAVITNFKIEIKKLTVDSVGVYFESKKAKKPRIVCYLLVLRKVLPSGD